MNNVFIIGSRGLPAHYGGFETFVENLVKNKNSGEIKYYVASQRDNSNYSDDEMFDYYGATVFQINAPNLGPAKAIAYDLQAFAKSFDIINKENIKKPIFMLLGNTIGGAILLIKKKIKAIGGTLIVNPDGLEWRRTKWSPLVRRYFLYAEKQMTTHADLIVADNMGIKEYLDDTYPGLGGKRSVIAYGTNETQSTLSSSDDKVHELKDKFGFIEDEYYLIVGRFVPENNYEMIIEAFMASNTDKKLVIVTNYVGNKYYDQLMHKTKFNTDSRIVFIGTVYDENLLSYLRQNAFAYIHGHSVGGTNPSLLEALGHSNYNLLYDVSFNRYVAENSGRYWANAEELTGQIDSPETTQAIEKMGLEAKGIINKKYTWDKIVSEYEKLFIGINNEFN